MSYVKQISASQSLCFASRNYRTDKCMDVHTRRNIIATLKIHAIASMPCLLQHKSAKKGYKSEFKYAKRASPLTKLLCFVDSCDDKRHGRCNTCIHIGLLATVSTLAQLKDA